MLNKIVNSCQYLLNNFPGAQNCREYLNSRLNKESQEKFQFGYFPNINDISILTSLIGEDILKENKLLYSRVIEDSYSPRVINFSFFENYPIIMPYKNCYGEIIALVGRTLLNDNDREKVKISKYKNTIFHKKDHVFGLYENKSAILEQDCVYIVEGQFDVIKSYESGFKNVVALGSSSMTSNQFCLIMRYTDNIFLLLDNDEAGKKGRSNIISKYGGFANIRNFYLSKEYKDIDEFLNNNDYSSLSFTIREPLF